MVLELRCYPWWNVEGSRAFNYDLVTHRTLEVLVFDPLDNFAALTRHLVND